MYNAKLPDETFYLPDEISDIVTEIQTGGKPYFRWGYWKEIVDIVTELSMNEVSTTEIFPMVCLSLLYKANEQDNLVSTPNDFDIYIIDQSDPEYSSDQRLTNVIKATIEPIYNDFATAMLDNKWFRNAERVLKCSNENIFKLGTEENNKNKLNLIVDAKRLSFRGTEIINLKNY